MLNVKQLDEIASQTATSGEYELTIFVFNYNTFRRSKRSTCVRRNLTPSRNVSE